MRRAPAPPRAARRAQAPAWRRRPRGTGTLALACLLALAPTAARAWESECRPDPAPYGGAATGHDMSICRGEDAPFCEPGLGFARGAQLGEHARIVREALRAAGLSSFGDRAFELAYWSDRHTVLTGDPGSPMQTLPTIAPARIGRMSAQVTRTLSIPAFAQVPDGSHSLGDFLFGNEHCPVGGLPRRPGVDNRACHTFATHMGMINSSHFVPQARDAYARYHAAAAAVARRCAALDEALAGMTHPYLVEHGPAMVQSCEREALALEAVGSHFLADALSTGHMWERWGSPLAPPTPALRHDAVVVAIVSGFIHGWRSVVRDILPVDPLELQHDRLCLAGPGDDGDADAVRWRRAGQAPVLGGGDLYLLPCTAFDRSRDHAVSTGAQYGRQYRRLLACAGRGFAEIYDLGPRTQGPRPEPQSTQLRELDRDVTSSSSDVCWESRVTNRSFRAGWDGTFDLTDPGRVTRLALRVAVGRTGATTGPSDSEIAVTRDRMRVQLAEMGLHVVRRARAAADDTDLATLGDGPMRRFLGYERNSDRRAEIASAPFLDGADPSEWRDSPGASCRADADCPSGEVCDPTAVALVGGPACVRHEASILRAFRPGELAYHCAHVTRDDLDAAREQCRLLGGAACEACADNLLPHLRNACNASSYAAAVAAGQTDHGSACDALREARVVSAAPAAVYRPHRRGDGAAARAAAVELCAAEPEPDLDGAVFLPPSSGPPPPPTASDVLDRIAGYFENNAFCGPVSDVAYWRYAHAPSDPHTHTFYVETTTYTDLPRVVPADRFAFERIAPCEPSGAVVEAAAPQDTDGDGVPDTLRIDWTPSSVAADEICLRVRSIDPGAATVTGLRFGFNP